MAQLTRQEAIELTDKFIAKLTPKSAMDIMGTDVTKAHKFACDMGVGGWYYDDKCTKFCNEVITHNIVVKALDWFSSVEDVMKAGHDEGWMLVCVDKDYTLQIQKNDEFPTKFRTDREASLYVAHKALTVGGVYSKVMNFLYENSRDEFDKINSRLSDTANVKLEVAVELAWQMPQDSRIPRAENRWQVLEHIDKIIEKYSLNEESEDIDEVVEKYLGTVEKRLHLVLSNNKMIFEGDIYWVVEKKEGKMDIVHNVYELIETVLDDNSDLSHIGYGSKEDAEGSIEDRSAEIIISQFSK